MGFFTNVYPKGEGSGNPHPFKIYLNIKETRSDGTPVYEAGLQSYSRLYTKMKFDEGKYLFFDDPMEIKDLDTIQEIPNTFPSKKMYCILSIDILDLKPKSAKIVWAPEDDKPETLSPINFIDRKNFRQIKANIILGILIEDDKKQPIFDEQETDQKSTYILQLVNTDLMLCNMVFEGAPVLYPVPFIGGMIDVPN